MLHSIVTICIYFNIMLQFSPILRYYITYLQNKVNNGCPTRECDYSKIMAIALPQYFDPLIYCIVPEFVLPDDLKPDYLVSLISTNDTDRGKSINHLNVETKNALAIS